MAFNFFCRLCAFSVEIEIRFHYRPRKQGREVIMAPADRVRLLAIRKRIAVTGLIKCATTKGKARLRPDNGKG